jgi:hypothetical protein
MRYGLGFYIAESGNLHSERWLRNVSVSHQSAEWIKSVQFPELMCLQETESRIQAQSALKQQKGTTRRGFINFSLGGVHETMRYLRALCISYSCLNFHLFRLMTSRKWEMHFYNPRLIKERTWYWNIRNLHRIFSLPLILASASCHVSGLGTRITELPWNHPKQIKLKSVLCKIWGFHGSGYADCRLLGYKNPVRTSQETHYVSVTESS